MTKSIKSYDLGSFSGKTIGVFERNHENIRRLQAYLEINALDCTLRTYTYEELMVTGNLNRFLESGEVDLLLGNSTDTRGDFVVAATFDSQPHYIVTTPGNQGGSRWAEHGARADIRGRSPVCRKTLCRQFHRG